MKNIQFLQIDFNLITDTKITSNEFRIYAYLLSLYNDNKKCSYPSLETIANKLNISLTTVNIQSVVSPVYENIEAGRGNYISNNKKRFTKKFSEEEIRKAEELENDLLGWY